MSGVGWYGDFGNLLTMATTGPVRFAAGRPQYPDGTGTSLLAPEPDVLILVDLARWEIQRRQRANQFGNFPAGDIYESAAAKYKRAFFVDWRVADRTKPLLLDRIDYLLDTNDPAAPKMATGEAFRAGLQCAMNRPFRVVPFFDPGPWGGQWMREVCDLPDGASNYAWCFDCVPEENSLLLDMAGVNIEIPAMDLVLHHPHELLGDAMYARFGAEFPIRFDFLDTMQGGNLSLQVHPLNQYILDNFGRPTHKTRAITCSTRRPTQPCIWVEDGYRPKGHDQRTSSRTRERHTV
jgi:hypothetical protein